MKADALTPRDLFDGKVQFEIPSFQRPYVWNEEDQWAPLWADIKRVAGRIIAADVEGEALDGVSAHFLGAVVLKEISAHAGDVARHAVIDGQQRMATLQILLDAAHAAVADLGYEEEAEALEELIINSGKRFAGTKNRFKLWPSRADRAAFEAAMDDAAKAVPEHRMTEAHTFFASEVRRWIVDGADEGETPVGTEAKRARALTEVLQLRLRLVAINLGLADDDQLIFETLNDRGTPLLAADLIKNWVFQRGEDLGADTEQWADVHWAELDDDWWREEISQGRYLRSRVDIFLQYWLTMRMRDEIASDGVFRRFREHTLDCMTSSAEASSFLQALRRDADTFRAFAQLDPDTPAGHFYARVVESFELAATTPLLLWMLSDNHRVPDAQVEVGLSALESWVMRRTLLRMTMKDVNKLMVAILGMFETRPVEEAGEAIRDFLAQQTADARVWPTDEDMLSSLPTLRLYGNVRQSRLRVILGAIEKQLRTERHEDVALPTKLEIEHVMPRSWKTHWDTDPPLSPEEAAARAKRVESLGNLTLVTQKLNGSLSHRPWTDHEAAVIAPKGKEAGRGKRWLLAQYSLLVLNKALVDEHLDSWTDEDIRERSQEMTERLCAIWPRADTPVTPAVRS
jgi:Protein of unknown function DUF262/Protein of unknown function (DUF1524)